MIQKGEYLGQQGFYDEANKILKELRGEISWDD